MTLVVRPKLEVEVTLSDGTVIKRESIEQVLQHLRTKMVSNSNVLSHYAHEIQRLNEEFEWVKRDHDELELHSKDEKSE